MTREEMVAVIDGEIHRLEQMRGLLAKSHSERFVLPEGSERTREEAKKPAPSPESRLQAQRHRAAKRSSAATLASEAQ